MEAVLTISRAESFFKKVDISSGCWNWTAYKDAAGYGTFSLMSRPYLAHRVSFMLFNGKLTKGMSIDHLCKNKGCVNPRHLEEVTPRTNTFRAESIVTQNARKTHCKHGHKLNRENTYIRRDRNGGRECRSCRRRAVKNYQLKGGY